MAEHGGAISAELLLAFAPREEGFKTHHRPPCLVPANNQVGQGQKGFRRPVFLAIGGHEDVGAYAILGLTVTSLGHVVEP
jgi:hypothetical protein